MSRLCRNHSRSYPGRSAPCPGKWRATEIDCGEERSSLTAEQKSAEVILAQGSIPGAPSEGPNREGAPRSAEMEWEDSPLPVQVGSESLGCSIRRMQGGGERAGPERYWCGACAVKRTVRMAEWMLNPVSPLSILGGHEPKAVAPAGCKAGVK